MASAHLAFLDRHVMIRRRNIDPPVQWAFTVCGMSSRKPASPAEDLGEDASAPGQVQNDENCGLEVCRQIRDERTDRLHSSCRCADDDDIVSSHGYVSAPFMPFRTTIRLWPSG